MFSEMLKVTDILYGIIPISVFKKYITEGINGRRFQNQRNGIFNF